MTQNQTPDQRPASIGSARAATHSIEKGWTVYDAVERPIGNVTDVDITRDVLVIDGRPEGIGTFEVPLSTVADAGDNDVHLTQMVDTSTLAAGGTPRFTEPSATTPTPRSSRARSKARTEPTPMAPPTAERPGSSATSPRMSTTSAGTGGISGFSPPYAATEPRDPGPAWGNEDDGWSLKKLAAGGLALGGLAAATYVMRRRMRRKTPYERFMDTASDYFGVASDFARDRHPAWWASVAAALPIAYYAWPSSKPTYTEQARGQVDDLSSVLGSMLAGVAGMMPGSSPSLTERARRSMPSFSGFELPSSWSTLSDWWPSFRKNSDWNFSPRPDVAGTMGALAAGALTIFLIRRAATRSRTGTRIADVMTRQPRVIQPDATVADAAAIMRRMDVGALPVCDGTRLIGMLTDRDITTRSTADGRDPHLTTVRDIMSAGVAWATEDDPVEEAARIMREHRIRRLPIVDERHSLVGVVSLGDLAVEVNDDELSGDTLERISEQTRHAREM